MGMQLIETIEVGSGGAASIEFTGIPQDGVDLVLKLSLRTNNSGNTDNGLIQLNNNTGAIYSHIRLQGSGSSVYSGSFTGNYFYVVIGGNNDTSNTFGSGNFIVSNYTSSSEKSCSSDAVNENNATLAYQDLKAHKFGNSSAVTSMELSPDSGTLFLQYSSASLYKITAD
jgi:hypothetical protein